MTDDTVYIRVKVSRENHKSVSKLEDKGRILEAVSESYQKSNIPFNEFVGDLAKLNQAKRVLQAARNAEKAAREDLKRANEELDAAERRKAEFDQHIDDRWMDLYHAAMVAAQNGHPVRLVDDWVRKYADKYFKQLAKEIIKVRSSTYEGKRDFLFGAAYEIADYLARNPDEIAKLSDAEKRIVTYLSDAVTTWYEAVSEPMA